MNSYSPMTPGGFSMYTMSSMLQKSIRRGDIDHASFAAKELRGNYYKYLWKRLLIISAEDCYGIITKEIIGLKIADDTANDGRKGYDRDPLFISKAIVLLCMARKNRDACYVACNFMHDDRQLRTDEIPEIYLQSVDFAELGDEGIPDWVFDVHTLEGRRNGKTDLDMTIDEQEALHPKQLCFFDDASWGIYYDHEIADGNINGRERREVEKFESGKEVDPTMGGLRMEKKRDVWGIVKGNSVLSKDGLNIPPGRLEVVAEALVEVLGDYADEPDIVEALEEKGLTREEIAHLGYEFLGKAMVKKSDIVREAVRSKDWKKALLLAKDFQIGISKSQREMMARAYECIVHPSFYMQIGVDVDSAIAKGVDVVSSIYG